MSQGTSGYHIVQVGALVYDESGNPVGVVQDVREDKLVVDENGTNHDVSWGAVQYADEDRVVLKDDLQDHGNLHSQQEQQSGEVY